MHINPNVGNYVVDFGKKEATMFDGKKVKVLTLKEVLALPETLPPNSNLFSEYAHLGCPQKALSLAQPFVDIVLLDFYARLKKANITLKLFPQQSMPRASKFSDLPKADDSDPIAVYNLLKEFPQISLMNPPTSFDTKDETLEGWQYKKDTNLMLNYARRYSRDEVGTHSTGYLLPKTEYGIDNDGIIDFLLNNLEEIHDRLDDTARDAFGLVKKNGKFSITTSTGSKWNIAMTQIYSILATLIDHTGSIRIRPSTQDIAGWAFIKKYVFCLTPFHFRGGVARSNLHYHGARNWIAKKCKEDGVLLKRGGLKDPNKITSFIHRGEFTPEQDKLFVKYRKQYFDSVRLLWQVSKSILFQTPEYVEHMKSITVS